MPQLVKFEENVTAAEQWTILLSKLLLTAARRPFEKKKKIVAVVCSIRVIMRGFLLEVMSIFVNFILPNQQQSRLAGTNYTDQHEAAQLWP